MTAHVLLASKEDVGGLEYNAVGQCKVLYSILSYCFRSVSRLLFRNNGTPAPQRLENIAKYKDDLLAIPGGIL